MGGRWVITGGDRVDWFNPPWLDIVDESEPFLLTTALLLPRVALSLERRSLLRRDVVVVNENKPPKLIEWPCCCWWWWRWPLPPLLPLLLQLLLWHELRLHPQQDTLRQLGGKGWSDRMHRSPEPTVPVNWTTGTTATCWGEDADSDDTSSKARAEVATLSWWTSCGPLSIPTWEAAILVVLVSQSIIKSYERNTRCWVFDTRFCWAPLRCFVHNVLGSIPCGYRDGNRLDTNGKFTLLLTTLSSTS